MKKVAKEEFLKGINFQQNIPFATIQELMNSNAQFVMEISIGLSMFSKNILFDHLNCYSSCSLFLPQKVFYEL